MESLLRHETHFPIGAFFLLWKSTSACSPILREHAEAKLSICFLDGSGQQPPENFCFTASICFFSAAVEGYHPFFAMQL